MLVKIGSVIFVAVVAPILVWFLVQKFSDKPIVKFNLTDPISTTTSEEKREFIQELFIKNVGKDQAEKISVKISGAGAKFEIKKNLASDVYKIITVDGDTEIDYESLRPGGEIKIIIKSPYSINKNSLKISHSKGLAVEAFSENSWALFGSFAYFCLILGCLLYFGYSMYCWGQTHVSYGKEEDFLNRKQPLLITDKKWKAAREEAKKTLLESSPALTSREEIKASFVYRFLNNKSCAKISDTEIDQFNNKCCDILKKYFSEYSNRAYTLKELALLFTIERPFHMPEAKWEGLQNSLSASYISKYIGDLYLSSRKTLKYEDIERPEFIAASKWSKIHSDLCSMVTGSVISEIFATKFSNVSRICEEAKGSGLPATHKDLIVNTALSIGIFKSWFRWTEDDAQKLLREIDGFDFIDATAKEPIIKFCNFIIDMQNQKSQLSEKETLISQEKVQINGLKNEVDAMKQKVNKQLEIINLILTCDYNFLDKIEDYNMPFSIGNEANLRLVAAVLRDKGVEEKFKRAKAEDGGGRYT